MRAPLDPKSERKALRGFGTDQKSLWLKIELLVNKVLFWILDSAGESNRGREPGLTATHFTTHNCLLATVGVLPLLETLTLSCLL